MNKQKDLPHPLDNEIENCSNSELLRIHRIAIIKNHNGHLDSRIDAIITEIQKRVQKIQAFLNKHGENSNEQSP